MKQVMKIVSLANGIPTPFDDTYLVDYDPGRNGLDPDGRPMLAYVVVTKDKAMAKVFENFGEIHECWTRVDPRQPVRPDGQPNRPLTAFTITTEGAPEQL